MRKHQHLVVMTAVLCLAIATGGWAAITDDLVCHLKFDGDLLDSSGSATNNNASEVGAWSDSYVTGQMGGATGAVSIPEAVDEYITVDDGAGHPCADFQFGTDTDFTVSFWIRSDKAPDAQVAIAGDSGGWEYPGWNVDATWNWIDSKDGQSLFKISDNSDAHWASPSWYPTNLCDGDWHQLCMVGDRDGRMYTYFDGVAIRSADISWMTGAMNSPNPVAIGQSGDGSMTDAFAMEVDDFAIWRRALTELEIAYIHAEGLAGNDISQITLPPRLNVVGGLSFADQVAGDAQPDSLAVTLGNAGGQNLTLSASFTGVDGGEFTIIGVPTSILPGESVVTTVTWNGGATGGVRAASLTITSNDPRSPIDIPISANLIEFQFPATGVNCIKQAMFLGIDDVSFPLRHNVVVQVSKPEIRPEAVLLPSRDNPNAPDNLAANFYGTVLHEPGITPGSTMRMWYYGLHQGRNPDWAEELKAQADKWQGQGWNMFVGPVCYAESKDGIHWEKVNLGQLLFKGNRDNNAFDLGSALTAGALVIKDEEDPDPQRRYKMTFWVQHHPLANSSVATIQSATSPDGIKWKTAEKLPMPNTFREEGSFYKHNGFYFAGAQTFELGPNGRNIERAGTTFISPDFDHWLHETSRSLVLPKGADGRRFEPHLGMGAKSFGNVLVGIYGRWDGPNHIVGQDITADLCLVVSNDGMKFREPDPESIFISSKENPAKCFTGKKLDTQRTILCQGNGILNVGDQTLIYYGRWARSYGDPSSWVEEDYSERVNNFETATCRI